MVVSSGRDHSCPGSGLDAHIAERHAPFHRERPHRRTRILDHMPRGAVGPDLPDDSQRQDPSRVTPSASRPRTSIFIVFGFCCARHCVARTCSTSDVPIPNASEPNAP